jgi:hypothetical protein
MLFSKAYDTPQGHDSGGSAFPHLPTELSSCCDTAAARAAARIPPEMLGGLIIAERPPGAGAGVAAVAISDEDESLPIPFVAHWPFVAQPTS